jgi:hypothetical protein
MSSFNILVIIITKDFLDEQRDIILNFSSISGFGTNTVTVSKLSDIEQAFDNCTTMYNYLYFTGHGNDKGTVIGDDENHYYWSDIVEIINKCGCICKDTLIYIQGCYSSNASKFILDNCCKINQVIGFEIELSNIEAYVSFINFIYYVTYLELETGKAIDKVRHTIYKNIFYHKRERIYKE